MTHMILYSRRGCHLCEDMIVDLDMAARGRDLDYDVVDVDSDPALAERYGLRVPVLTCAGEEVCHAHLDVARLNKILKS